jgi:hypothetical protein
MSLSSNEMPASAPVYCEPVPMAGWKPASQRSWFVQFLTGPFKDIDARTVRKSWETVAAEAGKRRVRSSERD